MQTKNRELSLFKQEMLKKPWARDRMDMCRKHVPGHHAEQCYLERGHKGWCEDWWWGLGSPFSLGSEDADEE